MRRIGWVGQRAGLALEVAAVAGGVGAQVVPLACPAAGDGPPRGAWNPPAVDVVLVDGALVAADADPWGGDPGGGWPQAAPPGVPVLVVCLAGEAQSFAASAGPGGPASASHVVELPRGAGWLAEQLSAPRGGVVVAVAGSVGGSGASTVALAMAAGAGGDALVVDGDPCSSGLDIPLGVPDGVGVRWEAIPPGDAPLDGASLRAALPVVGDLAVLTGILPTGQLSDRLPAVLAGARESFARTVVDAGRGQTVRACAVDALVLVVPATLPGVVGGRRLRDRVGGIVPVVAAMRPTPWLSRGDLEAELGCPVVAEVPRLARACELGDCGELLSGRTGRVLRRLGARLWGAVA